MAHSAELRARVVDLYSKETTPVAELARRLGVSRSSLYNWRRRLREYDSLQRSPGSGGRPPKLDEVGQNVLRRLVEQKPRASLAELCIELQAATGIRLHRSNLSRALHRMGLR